MNSNPSVVMNFKVGQPVKITVNGVKGSACKAFSEAFQTAIGGKIVSDIPTSEMSETAVAATTQQQLTQKAF